ncbi:glycoside hydrolase [Exidia glandulosa HHB12029]|uniref:glucan 1,3-beta-glucosidase n=1 Tax=Exidia glandulosa HHB12029 TaxID=1314781 RepID=A0A165CVR7_EXIGL|nr:glycoside hydrolase [Exidia glandulosa HHB12029]
MKPQQPAAPAWANTPKRKNNKRRILIIVGALVVLVIIIVVVVYFAAIKPKSKSGSGSGSGSGKSNGTTTGPTKLFIGKDGDTVTKEDGTSFTYKNRHGGIFVIDPQNPYNDGARPQSWTKALNETWKFGEDKIFGVNLGGWLVPEPFIAPALYEKYFDDPSVVGDEWTLSEAMTKDQAGGGLKQMETHYQTFITEEDFAQIAGAGLNWIRLPVGLNAFGTIEGEPFLANTSWTYVLKAFEWARKYGLRINIDLHTLPGSQNSLNHSGKQGRTAWMTSSMGLVNAQRSMNFMRGVAEFISQPEYKNLVPIFGIANEPQGQDQGNMKAFYYEMYKEIRAITGVGEGKGPYISISDGFQGLGAWETYLTGADRLALDWHVYFAFGADNSPVFGDYPKAPCGAWGVPLNHSLGTFGFTYAGEWSLAFNDCGLYIRDFRKDAQTQGCDPTWTDYEKWTPDTKAQFMTFAKTHMEAIANFFFWTWKTGVSSRTGKISAPMWNYQLGLEQGWIPDDPRTATGTCEAAGAGPKEDQFFNGPLKPWQTGGAGANTFAPEATAGLDWPPPALLSLGSPLPTLTATGPVPMLPTATFPPSATVTEAKGWADPQDKTGAYVPVANCKYPDSWNPTENAMTC